jgi:hypothetical protein
VGEIRAALREMVKDIEPGNMQEWSDAKGLDDEDFCTAMAEFADDGSNLAEALLARTLVIAKEEGLNAEETVAALPEVARAVLMAIAAASFRLGYTVAEARMGKEILGE